MENSGCSSRLFSDVPELSSILVQAYKEEKYLLLNNMIRKNYFSWSNLDDALFSWEFDDDIKIYLDGNVSVDKYIERYSDFGKMKHRIIKHKFYDYIDSGASVVLNKFQNKSRTINDLCLFVAQITGAPTNANAYAARGGDGTFDLHWDTHDVFAFQLIGRKRWRIYAPTFEKPLPHQKSSAFKSLRPTEPVADIILEQGDILYIPRGWWHEAIPLDHQDTFHIAVGVFPIKIIDYFQWIISKKLCNVLAGREYLNNFKQNIIATASESLISMAHSSDNYNEFLFQYQSGIRMKSAFNSGIFFENKTICPEDATYNGIFNWNNSYGTVVNGVKIQYSDQDNLIVKKLMFNDDTNVTVQDLDTDVMRHLYKMDIIS